MPVTAVRILNNHALPFFEEHAVKVQTILSDNGREYCGRPDKHPYELFLQLEEIEHRTTKVGRPQSNGLIERFHRTLLEEHLRINDPDDLVRDGCGDAEGPGCLLGDLQPPAATPRPRHEGQDALRRLQGRDPEESPARGTSRQKGGQDRSVDPTSARPGVR